jgi:hypothetical protein
VDRDRVLARARAGRSLIYRLEGAAAQQQAENVAVVHSRGGRILRDISVNRGAEVLHPINPVRMRRKLRWLLISPEGEEVRSGLSFGAFDDDSALERARVAAAPPLGFELQVFLDGQRIEPAPTA